MVSKPCEFAAARGQNPGGSPGREAEIWGHRWRDSTVGFRVFPSRNNQCTLYFSIYLDHCVAGGRAVPPDVREEPGGALYVHSP